MASVSESMLKVIDENMRMGVAIGAQENVSTAVDSVNNVGNQQGALNTTSATLQAVDSVQGARSGSISASAGLVAEWSKQESEDSSQAASSTLILADNDLSFISGGDQRHVGTLASAGNNLLVEAGGDVTIESAQNTISHQDKSTNASMNVGLGSDSGASVTVAGGYANNRSQQIQQVNAHFSAGNTAMINVTDDLTLAGAVVSATNIDAEIGGDLTIESRQDTGYTRGESAQGSVSIGTGSVGLNLSGSHTEGDSAWVYEQSGLLASEAANIYVEDHTSLIGGVINSDSGDLTLDTGTFSYQDVHDYDHFESVSLGFGLGVPQGQAGTTPDTASEESRMPGVDMNNLTAGYQNQEREQVTRATVGEGTITVRGDQQNGENSLEGLNRDMSLAQEITRDEEENYNLYVSDSSLQGLGLLDRDENDNNSQLDQLKDTLNLTLAISEIGESSMGGIDDVDNALVDGLSIGMAEPQNGSLGLLNDHAMEDLAGQVGDGLLASGQLLFNRDHEGGFNLFGFGQGNDLAAHYERNQYARLKQEVIREILVRISKEEGSENLLDAVNNLTDYDAELSQQVLSDVLSEIAGEAYAMGFYTADGTYAGMRDAEAFINQIARQVGLNVDELNIRDARVVMSAIGEEGYHGLEGADDNYAHLFGDRFGYLWDKENRESGLRTGGVTETGIWRAGNSALLTQNAASFRDYNFNLLEFRQLLPPDREVAAFLAQHSSGLYRVEEIENAMRGLPNHNFSEASHDNALIDLQDPRMMEGWGSLFYDTGGNWSVLPDANGNPRFLYQDPGSVNIEIAEFIVGTTGGVDSAYYPGASLLQSGDDGADTAFSPYQFFLNLDGNEYSVSGITENQACAGKNHSCLLQIRSLPYQMGLVPVDQEGGRYYLNAYDSEVRRYLDKYYETSYQSAGDGLATTVVVAPFTAPVSTPASLGAYGVSFYYSDDKLGKVFDMAFGYTVGRFWRYTAGQGSHPLDEANTVRLENAASLLGGSFFSEVRDDIQ